MNEIFIGFGLLGVLLILGYGLFCFFMAEAMLIRSLKGEMPQETQNTGSTHDSMNVRGVEDALKFSLKTRQVSHLKPRVVITPEVANQARVARRPGGGGIVLLSRGLIEVVSDRELVHILTLAVETLSAGRVTVRSALSTFWLHLRPLYREPHTPLRALFSWGLLPLERYLNKRHESLDLLSQHSMQSLKK